MFTTQIFLKPVNAKFFNNSQPIPPAPMTKTRHSKALKKSEERQVIEEIFDYNLKNSAK